jgi:hypothetical protein
MCAGAKKEFGAGMGPRKMAFKKKTWPGKDMRYRSDW